jgi:hypothetical protein
LAPQQQGWVLWYLLLLVLEIDLLLCLVFLLQQVLVRPQQLG